MTPFHIDSLFGDLLENKPFGGLSALVAYLATVLGVILVTYAVGPTITTIYTHDTLYLLNVGHRISEGYRPFIDFHMAYGPLPFMFAALGIAIAGPSIEALWIGQMFAVLLLGSLCFYVCLNRLSLFWTILATLNATTLLTMPSPLGYKVWRDFGYAMWYNKIGFVLLGILLLSIMIPLRQPTMRGRIIGSILEGTVLGLIATTKYTYFVPALGCYLFAKLLWPQRGDDRRSESFWALGAMGLVFFSSLTVCHTTAWAYIENIRAAGTSIEGPAILLLARYLQYTNMIFFVFIILVLAFGGSVQKGMTIRPFLRSAILCSIAVACLLISTATSCQELDVIPFLGVITLSACLCVRRHVPFQTGNAHVMSVAVLATILLLATFPKDSALSTLFMFRSPPALVRDGVGAGLADPAEKKGQVAEVDRRFRYLSRQWKAGTLSALSLLKEGRCAAGDVLFVCKAVDDVTMFSTCSYPKGAKGIYSWESTQAFTDAALAKRYSDEFLAETRWILRSDEDLPIWENLMRAKGKYIAAHFVEVGKTDNWTLYKRQ